MGQDVNLWLVRNGWAWQFLRYNRSEELAAAQRAAQAEGLGLWHGFRPMPPWEFRELKRAPAGVAAGDEAAAGGSPGRFWFNTSSNVRHNERCRWFGKTKRGRSGGPGEGKACGDCGG